MDRCPLASRLAHRGKLGEQSRELNVPCHRRLRWLGTLVYLLSGKVIMQLTTLVVMVRANHGCSFTGRSSRPP